MRNKLNKSITALSLALGIGMGVAGVGFIAPVWADNAELGSFIDPEFENAVRKHVEKRFFNLIDATDAQRNTLDELFKQRMESTRPVREEIRKGFVEVSQMMADESVSDDQIIKKVHEIRALREKLMDGRLETALKVRATLTKEQKQTVSNRIIGFLTGNSKRHLLKSMLLERAGSI
ncbi:MAG TPA: periplasmic heavy metal sensor [Candidatus Obscuribacterales bacterium]